MVNGAHNVRVRGGYLPFHGPVRAAGGKVGGHLALGRICKQRCSVTSLKVYTFSVKNLHQTFSGQYLCTVPLNSLYLLAHLHD